MKRFSMLLAAGIVASVSILVGCSSAPALTFQQQVAIACGAANGEIAILKADGVFTGGAATMLDDTVQPAIAKVCAVGATITTPDLQTIVNATLPALKALVDASSLPNKAAADAAIDTAVLAFNVAISMNQAVAAPPAAASTPLAGSAL
ncbi:hypothetical protein K6W26_23235 [Burkholderia sp. AU42008]|uniref:hypothetical protein n=1 Tax=unclassified Burkholderia TaxID=2613784 RepID=UPI000B7AA982|nr:MULTISPECIES: hypothetical protein [unclassified Burkholderia]MBR8234585.1 hypothetical protein [Burkholderia sp. AU32357]MBY4875972.1 hypothetical protein [Burkholderia sp. AU42008]OXI44957.1 hypothetical protein CFB49_07830 [Burkholderia sp. AU17457]